MRSPRLTATLSLGVLSALLPSAFGQAPPGEGPSLGPVRTTQASLVSGTMTLSQIRAAGLKMFSTPFNKLDGYGDGPMDPLDPTSPGARPTLQNNGTFLRVNGLDAQTCMECHAVGSNAVVPFRFAVGGVGGSNTNVIFQPRTIDVSDTAGFNYAFVDGRYINPPFLFGSGGVELAAKEMTFDLQRLRFKAATNPDRVIPLTTHGVNFGSIVLDSQTGQLDLSNVQGIDDDLVVRAFGRKGEFPSVRAFDLEAMSFHFGMQPIEVVGQNFDADNDGVENEITIGEISALHIFNTNLERPTVQGVTPASQAGAQHFSAFGCANCHKPFLDTRSPVLTYTFPEVPTDPQANPFYSVDLRTTPAGFDPSPLGGIRVPLFSDLKRHDMGPGLAESFGTPLDSQFITARLWGVADTAPYLHDGRALTLTDAILAHGGEAQAARDAFDQAAPAQRVELLTFLRTLRTPVDPAADLLP